jgi:hypothetical protein
MLATPSARIAVGPWSPRPRRLPAAVSQAPLLLYRVATPGPDPLHHAAVTALKSIKRRRHPFSPLRALLALKHHATPLLHPLQLLSSPASKEPSLRRSQSRRRGAPSCRAISAAYSTRCRPVSSATPSPCPKLSLCVIDVEDKDPAAPPPERHHH